MTLPLILASQSASRSALLTRVGIPFAQVPSLVDEEVHKDHFLKTHTGPLSALAVFLAHQKGRDVSLRHPEALVLAADQILVFQETLYNKAKTLSEAETILKRLRHQTHTLPTAMVLYRGGEAVWDHLAIPTLKMRNFSDAFLQTYLQQNSQTLLSAVGCYQIEGAGLHLMAQVTGDSDTIQGLSLLPLMDTLRHWGLLPS
ncbi:MAG: Maf family protein [Alphaproteobacteria bacterium]